MDNNTFGVLGTEEARTQYDITLQQDFNCQRVSLSPQYKSGDGIGVIGSNIDERTDSDRQLQRDYGCVKEGYRQIDTVQMIEPRTEYDMQMLRQFGGCGEGYNSLQARKLSMQRRENFCPMARSCRGGCGCMGKCRCPRCSYREDFGVGLTNGQQYNTSSNVKYLPLR